MLIKYLSAAFCLFVLTSCVTNKFVTSSGTKSSEVGEVAYLQPFSYVSYIEKGNRTSPSDS